MKAKDHDMAAERALQVCTYSGSSSDTETEPEETGRPPQRTLILRSKKSDSVDQNEETLKRSSVEKPLSIMDFYQHDMYSHLEKDTRRISQYALLHKESSLEAGDRLSKDISMEKMSVGTQPDSLDLSLESLNKLNGSLGLRREGCQADGGKSGDGCKLEEPSSSSFSSRPGGGSSGLPQRLALRQLLLLHQPGLQRGVGPPRRKIILIETPPLTPQGFF
ncbi:hypothetical protein OYC64_014059 [Pagothenia borchgrevinki]|uniref:Uncharacterized protein n=1 Tax=Pagothenia borchgrevinki TaxID=8213 RepID=A0ABD2FWI9_PAGBO